MTRPIHEMQIERNLLNICQRRYRELVEGKVAGIQGPLVFNRLRSQLRNEFDSSDTNTGPN